MESRRRIPAVTQLEETVPQATGTLWANCKPWTGSEAVGGGYGVRRYRMPPLGAQQSPHGVSNGLCQRVLWRYLKLEWPSRLWVLDPGQEPVPPSQ
ncbi:hypothetical protein CCMA1212_003834 [Trichoderma ghanense]|uniref:Uncharacterized protein n=1 Tax=Trichoderma ghanense TaxID=65468 RepID=A0ABY2H6V8_9HYPO